MHRVLNGPVARFEAVDEEKQEQFRGDLVSFRNLYFFMAQIIPFQDADLEKLYAFIRLLIPRLSKRGVGPAVTIDDEVALRYYRLQRTSEGSIALTAGDRGSVPAPTAVATGKDHHEEVELSRLIDVVNERFATDFKPADQLFFEQLREESVSDTAIRQPPS
jgi:type I restriction enzyme R subunit